MSKFPWKTMLAGLAIVATTVYAFAQMQPGMNDSMAEMHRRMIQGQAVQGGAQDDARGGTHDGMRGNMQGGMGQHGAMRGRQSGAMPNSPGQDAFGAIQEVVQILEADPMTDWSKVDIGALREHLIDMNEVTLRAVATERMTDTGIAITVTGEGRTRDAILRMVPAHARELVAHGWKATTVERPDGVTLSVAANDQMPLVKLKALGFIGIMVQGGHHQPHHLAMAKGQFVH